MYILTEKNPTLFSIKQGVGQGRVMSAWFFLVFINDLICELKASMNGISVYGMSIPCVLLADDTTLVSATPRALQSSLNIVRTYANKWRLTYNASKSKSLVFCKPRQPHNKVKYTFGNAIIDNFDSVQYGGIIINSNLSCKDRVISCCSKARKSVNSLRSLGLNNVDLHPNTCVKIWKRMILSTSFYGCELLPTLYGKQLELIETTQRYFARRVQGFNKRSPSDSTISNLGLWSMNGFIDKCRLQLLGRLCNIECNSIAKDLFCAFVATNANRASKCDLSICNTLISTASKYNLNNYITDYVNRGCFPSKSNWRTIVFKRISEYEQLSWRERIVHRCDLSRYTIIHNCLKMHILYDVIYVHPQLRQQLQLCIKIGSREKVSKECTYCNRHCFDFDCHTILHCEHFMSERNLFFSSLIDKIDLDIYVQIEMLDDDNMLSLFLGADIDIITSVMDYNSWEYTIISFCEYIWKFKNTLMYIY